MSNSGPKYNQKRLLGKIKKGQKREKLRRGGRSISQRLHYDSHISVNNSSNSINVFMSKILNTRWLASLHQRVYGRVFMTRKLSLAGLWTGYLIDIQGFEGEFSLELRQKENRAHGTYNVIIRDEEALLSQKGIVEGEVLQDKFDLVFVSKDKDSVKIRMEGAIRSLREKGLGIRATYSVSGKSISPFQGGIASARIIKSLPSVRIEERSKFKDV